MLARAGAIIKSVASVKVRNAIDTIERDRFVVFMPYDCVEKSNMGKISNIIINRLYFGGFRMSNRIINCNYMKKDKKDNEDCPW